ncbi:MAG TPA: C45 family peptidase, partial [Arenicellales bacterium]|nr:C45 family peptidase [Arenicellales bacterium]
ESSSLAWCDAAGAPHQVGWTLGRQGRDAAHDALVPSEAWRTIVRQAGSTRVRRMGAATREAFPDIWEELAGLAEGLDLPFEDVLAWNCRGDLLAASADGCTTVQVPGRTIHIAHNEDGLPFLRGRCFIARVEANGQPGFVTFCYPASLPGHTFAFTDRGLVATGNNVRLAGVEPELPRMVLARALLQSNSLDNALALLRGAPATGGFHFTLAQVGDPRLFSAEIGGGNACVTEITEPAVHTNHALRPPLADRPQIVTDSSRDRQARATDLLAANEVSPLEILRDTGGPGLPIYRDDPDDPDEENTLATADFVIDTEGLYWRIHDRPSGTPVYAARYTPGDDAEAFR